MRILKDILICVLFGSLIFTVCCVGLFFIHAQESIDKVGDTAESATIALNGVSMIMVDLSDSVNVLTPELKRDAARISVDLGSARRDLTSEIQAFRSVLNKALGSIPLREIGSAVEKLSGIRDDLNPLLVESAAAMQEFHHDAKVLLPFTTGAIAAAKVTLGEAAITSKVIAKAAPEFARTSQELADNINGIAGDVHVVADKYVKPKTKKERVLDILTIVGIAALHVI